MIYAEIKDIGRYSGLGGHLEGVIAYLCSHPLEGLAAGHYEIDADKAYLNVFEYETVAEEEAFFEAHGRYADIHIILEGEELLGVSDRSRVAVKSFDDSRDLYEIEGPVEHYMRLIPGKAAIVFPEDAHKVKVAAGAPRMVRKAVLKVYVGGKDEEQRQI